MPVGGFQLQEYLTMVLHITARARGLVEHPRGVRVRADINTAANIADRVDLYGGSVCKPGRDDSLHGEALFAEL